MGVALLSAGLPRWYYILQRSLNLRHFIVGKELAEPVLFMPERIHAIFNQCPDAVIDDQEEAGFVEDGLIECRSGCIMTRTFCMEGIVVKAVKSALLFADDPAGRGYTEYEGEETKGNDWQHRHQTYYLKYTYRKGVLHKIYLYTQFKQPGQTWARS